MGNLHQPGILKNPFYPVLQFTFEFKSFDWFEAGLTYSENISQHTVDLFVFTYWQFFV
jgi:hypothetical protein